MIKPARVSRLALPLLQGYGLASLEENILDAGLPVRQPHLEAFLEGFWMPSIWKTESLNWSPTSWCWKGAKERIWMIDFDKNN